MYKCVGIYKILLNLLVDHRENNKDQLHHFLIIFEPIFPINKIYKQPFLLYYVVMLIEAARKGAAEIFFPIQNSFIIFAGGKIPPHIHTLHTVHIHI